MVTFSACALVCLLSSADNVVLMEFTADWCGACRSAEPTVKRLIAEGYPVHPVNIDREPETAARFRVTSVPCFVLVRQGQEIDRVLGAASHARLLQMFERGNVRTSAPQQLVSSREPAFVRGQSPDRASGLALPRPLASLAKGFAGRAASRRRAGSEMDPVEITQSAPSDPSWADQRDASQPSAALATNGALATQSGAGPAHQALRATVRLRVEDGTGHSLGTGTIIDSHGSESLAVTCAHIFRESQGKGQISVDLFADNQPRTVQGSLISYDLDRDIALVALAPGFPIEPVRVAPPGFRLATGQPVFSIGCDKGADPSIRESSITSIDRYVGSPNLEVAGMPVDGRSGGGLFSAEGYLIGICNAADPQDQEGIFASLPVIHWELDKIGQRKIYDPQDEILAGPPPRRPTSAPDTREVAAASGLPREMPRTQVMIDGPGAVPEAANEDMEVICIMRSRSNPQGSQRLVVLDRPSRELLDRLASESQRPSATVAQAAANRTINATTQDRLNPHSPNIDRGQTIRAQSEDR